mgnify:CR=1 FL=1
MAMLTKEQIIQARTASVKKVTIEALNGEVLIRMMSMREQLQLSDALDDLKEDEVAALYASYLLSNDDGSRMYSTPEDVEQLGSELTMEALKEITDVGKSMNGTSSAEVEEAAKK